MRICAPDPAQGRALQDSLTIIRRVQGELNVLTSSSTTPTGLASRIELCEVLLREISGIRSSLAEHLKDAREAGRPVY